MCETGHYASDEIESRVEGLFQLWEELQKATEEKSNALEEALSLLQFKRKVDSVHVLVAERVSGQCICLKILLQGIITICSFHISSFIYTYIYIV